MGEILRPVLSNFKIHFLFSTSKGSPAKMSPVVSTTKLDESQKPEIIAKKFSDLAGGICGGCGQDHGCYHCCKAYLCAPAAVGDIAKASGSSACGCAFANMCCCSGIYAIIHSCCVLPKLRVIHRMPERKLRDCCVHCFCAPCGRAQELRFIHKAQELRLAAAVAGQRSVRVGPTRQSMPGAD